MKHLLGFFLFVFYFYFFDFLLNESKSLDGLRHGIKQDPQSIWYQCKMHWRYDIRTSIVQPVI